MKLIQELLILREEAIETKAASDIWKESKDKIKTYITNATYLARVKKNSDPKKYEVFQDVNNNRKTIGTFSVDEFDAAYAPVRANQTEDAEGYKMYRDAEETEAFKYDGDTVKVDLEGQTGKLKGGDYLIRASDGDNFTYSIESAKYFDTDYAEKK
jgi:hypothetical protein